MIVQFDSKIFGNLNSTEIFFKNFEKLVKHQVLLKDLLKILKALI